MLEERNLCTVACKTGFERLLEEEKGKMIKLGKWQVQKEKNKNLKWHRGKVA